MAEEQQLLTDRARAARKCDQVIEVILGALLLFMPLSFGAVEPWSELVIILLSVLMMLCLAARSIWDRSYGFRRTWIYGCMIIFVLLAVFQMLPLPAGLARLISPNTVTVKSNLLSDMPNASKVLSHISLSFYPLATERNLRLVLVMVFIFVAVLQVYRRPEAIKRILLVITLIGAVVGILAILQNIFDNGKIYWVVPAVHGRANSGPFINHSHFCQFMNLSIGAALGLLLVKLQEIYGQVTHTLPEIIERARYPEFRIVWICFAVIVMGMACVFLSLSRGGMVSLLIAGGFTTVVLALQRNLQGRNWLITVLALASFVCVLYIGFDAVYDRLASLQDVQESQMGRWQIVKDISVEWMKFPLMGTGLGTHDVVYPMFDRSTIAALASHAENEYAQTAEETGIIGLLAVLFFITVIGRNFLGTIRGRKRAIQFAAIGLGYGIVAILLHSLSDFGQHIPANAALTAVSCALIINLARLAPGRHLVEGRGTTDRSDAESVVPQGIPVLRVVMGLLLLGVGGWMVEGAYKDYVAAGYYHKAYKMEQDLTKKGWLGTNAEYAEIIQNASRACENQPRDVTYRYWLDVYRWHAISRVTDPNTGDLVIVPQTLKFTRRIVDDLYQARLLCPTYGPIYCVAGQLEAFILNEPVGLINIRKGYKLSPYDATTSFLAGMLDAREGDLDASLKKFRRALKLDRKFLSDITDVYLHQVNRPDLAVQIAGDDVYSLSYVARALSEQQDPEHRELADKACREVMDMLREKCRDPSVKGGTLATMGYLSYRQGAYQDAVEYYRRALVLDYGRMAWHLMLARCLAKTGRLDDALKEARVCLRYDMNNKEAKQLVEELVLRSKADKGN